MVSVSVTSSKRRNVCFKEGLVKLLDFQITEGIFGSASQSLPRRGVGFIVNLMPPRNFTVHQRARSRLLCVPKSFEHFSDSKILL